MSAALRSRADARAAPWRAVVWLLLGLLVVAHGCHGDKDTELFTRLRAAAGQR
jgi:hypothetical protein